MLTITDPRELGAAADQGAAAMDRAVELAANGPVHGPNPRVGCVIADSEGRMLGEGCHAGAGTPHAEVAALNDAKSKGNDVAGAIAYVTLEPCAHTGRTGPCTEALIDAGIARVEYAVKDPDAQAAGGAEVLRAHGVEAELVPSASALDLNRRWLHALTQYRPYVIVKWAATLDGRTAAVDGTSFWITGEAARDHAHQVRAEVDAVVVGTSTVFTDNPRLSARPKGVENPHQPLRVVMGHRPTDEAEVWRDENVMAAHTHDPLTVLSDLHDQDVRTVLIEGGATVTTAFLNAGVVDEIHAYIAPVVLGSGLSAVTDLGITTMNAALRGENVTVTPLGADTLVTVLLLRGS